MHEMLLVGRGGEGVVLASQILADALVRAGFWAQSFPEFKAERRGAPISAFLRWDDIPIRRRYRVQECDVLLAISRSAPAPSVLATVRPDGLVLLNHDARYPYRAAFDIARVPASRIARERGVLSSEGRPMGNTAVLGACFRLLFPDRLGFLEEAIAARMGPAADLNVCAARDGFDRCVRQRSRAHDRVLERSAVHLASTPTPTFPMSTADSFSIQTGSWSLDRPVLTDACTACALCALFCPEGAIGRVGGAILIDQLHCKGCGICETVCPVRGAVRMEEVAA